MSKKKICKSCSGQLDDFDEKDIKKEGFCPYCVDKQGQLKSYGDVLAGMLEYIEAEHSEIDKKDRLSTAQKWLQEGEVWKERYVSNDIVIDIVHKNDLARIQAHEHKKEGFSHSCGECMYYQACDDSVDAKEEWLSQMEKKYGTCANVVYYKNDLIGFLQYAPKQEFPKLKEEPGDTEPSNDWYIACIYVDSGIPEETRKKIVRLSLKYILKSLGKRQIETAQISAPIDAETLSSTPYNWEFYESLGFDEIDRDNEWVLGRIKLK
jgi:hypothetical protein